MKARAFRLGLIGILLFTAGCSTSPIVQPTNAGVAPRKTIEFEVSQIREFKASKRETFDATQAVMKNAGYVIETADFEAGVLNGKAPIATIDRLLLAPISKSVTASALVDGGSETGTRIQIDFVSTVETPGRAYGNGRIVRQDGVTDLAIYQRVFDEIQEMLYPEQL